MSQDQDQEQQELQQQQPSLQHPGKINPICLIIGISGVTCSGKTTLATGLLNYFRKNKGLSISNTKSIIGDVFLLNQDQYFLSPNDSRHQYIEILKHNNWEILTALDMDKMISDIHKILKDNFCDNSVTTFQEQLQHQQQHQHQHQQEKEEQQQVQQQSKKHTCPCSPVKVNILLIEGFLIFNHPQLLELCQLKFHLHIPYEKCYERRRARVYDPPDVTGYFEMIVWPMYEKHFREYRDREDIIMLNGDLPKERIFNYVLGFIKDAL